MSTRRFRRVSLRITLFGVVPLCAVGFFVCSRTTSANRNLAIYQSLLTSGVIYGGKGGGGSFADDEVWWAYFWGGSPLSAFTHVSISGTNEQLDALRDLPNLQELDFNIPVPDVTPKRIEELVGQHPGLRKVSVTVGNLSPETYQAISRIPTLRRFAASACNFTDQDLREFEDCSLQSLEIFECGLTTRKCCQSIAKMTELTNLSLHALPIDDQTLSQLASLTSLEALNLHKTEITGWGLSVIRQMPALTALSVSDCPINDEAFEHIQSLGNLTLLGMDHTPLDDDRLQRMSHFTDLKSLSINGTDVTDESMLLVQRFESLRELHINFTRISDDGIQRLKGLPNLQTLHCTGTYTSPTAMKRFLDDVEPENLTWDGAAVVETDSAKIVGYIPAYPENVSNTNAVVGPAIAQHVEVFPLVHGEPFVTVRGRHSQAVLSDVGDWLATVSGGQLRTYELPSGRLSSTANVANANLESISLEQLITTTLATLQAWDVRSGQVLWSRAIKLKSSDDLPVHGPNRMWVKNPFGITLVKTDTGEAMVVGSADPATPLRVDATNQYAFAMKEDRPIVAHRLNGGRIKVYDLDSSTTIVTIDAMGERFAISKDAQRLAVYDDAEQTMAIFDVQSGKQMGNLTIVVNPARKNEPGSQFRFTPDGRHLVVDLDPVLDRHRVW